MPPKSKNTPLFVFQSDDPRLNGVKLLTPVSDLIFDGLSDGSFHFALYGSSLNHNLIGWNNSNSQSESFVLVVLKAAMERKKKGTIWKSNESWVRNWCQKWHTILFTATNRENKQWTVYILQVHVIFILIVCHCIEWHRDQQDLNAWKVKSLAANAN